MIAGSVSAVAGAASAVIQGKSATEVAQGAALGFTGGVLGTFAVATAVSLGAGTIMSTFVAGAVGALYNAWGQVVMSSSYSINAGATVGAFSGSAAGWLMTFSLLGKGPFGALGGAGSLITSMVLPTVTASAVTVSMRALGPAIGAGLSKRQPNGPCS
jgi:hypothetical protein